ncbi:MAG: hypothetical protein ABSF25_23025 [Bryobacteraceae bacterium]|jgi:hypothetical protein
MNARFALAVLLALPAWGWQAADQTLQEKLAAPSASYSINATGSLDAFLSVAGDFKLPMGIEWIKVTAGDVPLSRSWQGATPSAILQDVVKAYPGYELEISNGVVHVYPAAMRGDRGDILNVRIGSFEVQDEYLNFAAYLLARKVQPIMVPPDPNAKGGRGFSIASGVGEQRVTLALQNVTVREVLDKLCLSSNRNVWIVAYPAAPTKTRGGFLKTVRLDRTEARDDDAFSPDWGFLEWGEKFVPRD